MSASVSLYVSVYVVCVCVSVYLYVEGGRRTYLQSLSGVLFLKKNCESIDQQDEPCEEETEDKISFDRIETTISDIEQNGDCVSLCTFHYKKTKRQMKYKLNICALKNVVNKNLQNTKIKYLHEYMKTEEGNVTSELTG